MPYKYDPELRPVLAPAQVAMAQLPPVAVHDVTTRRNRAEAALLAMLDAVPLGDGVDKKLFRTATDDGHELEMAWYSLASTAKVEAGPALLHIHGGGLTAFGVSSFHVLVNNTVAESGVPMLSVDYRLAPEHPYPTPLEDCYTSLVWVRDHAEELNVDPTRIGVMGESAGGGLAAGVTLLARDRGFSPPLAKQILVYPMLDDRNTVPDEDLLPFVTYTWDDNLTNWSAYLGRDSVGTDQVSQYAAPAREMNLSKLPATYIDVGELDVFAQEDLEYARRLAAGKVSVEFHLYPEAPHGFENFVPTAGVSSRAINNRTAAIKSF